MPSQEPNNPGDLPSYFERTYLELMLKAHYETSYQADKLLVTLAGGALGLSIAFLDKIAPKPAHSVTWAAWGWTLLAASLLASLGSLIASRLTTAHEVEMYWEASDRNADPDEVASRAREAAAPMNRWIVWTEVANGASLLLLVGGIACLIMFARFNLGEG